MKNVKINLCMPLLPCYAIAHKNGRKTLELQAFDGEICCDVQYDYAREPLRLRAMVEEKDTVDLVLLPHRIELYVNGVLVDEEWPAGERLFAFGDEINATVDLSVEQYYEVIEDEPNVTASFEELTP